MRDIGLLQGKTILVTGATGFIGSHIVRRLKTIPDVRIITLSRRSVRDDHDEITHVQSSLDQLSKTVWRDNGVDTIDFVFHLGAFIPKNRGDSNNIERIYEDNLLGTRCLLESLPAIPMKVLFASTIDVYASCSDGKPIDETSPIEPFSLYGASKLFCEQLIQFYARQLKCPFAILRYGHIFGPGEEVYEKLIPQTIKRLLRSEAPVLVGDGREERDFLYVSDAVEATLRAAVSESPELGPVNIVRGTSHPVREIVTMLMRLSDYKGDICSVPVQQPSHSMRFDNSRMCELLGDWSKVSLEDGLKEEILHMKGLKDDRNILC